MLKVKTITAGYGAADILHDVELHVDTGEIVALLGANGAGKSTLLKIITGLLQPRQGSIWFEDQQIDGKRPEDLLRRGIALVPERRRIFAGLTVLENLQMGAYIERNKEVMSMRNFLCSRIVVASKGKPYPVANNSNWQLPGP